MTKQRRETEIQTIWETTKDHTAKVWDKTKEFAEETYDAVKEAAKDAWQSAHEDNDKNNSKEK